MNGSELNTKKPMACRDCGLTPLYWDKYENAAGEIRSRLFTPAGELHACLRQQAPAKPTAQVDPDAPYLSPLQRQALAGAGSGQTLMTDSNVPHASAQHPVVPINLVPASYPQLWAQYQELKRLFEGVPGA